MDFYLLGSVTLLPVPSPKPVDHGEPATLKHSLSHGPAIFHCHQTSIHLLHFSVIYHVSYKFILSRTNSLSFGPTVFLELLVPGWVLILVKVEYRLGSVWEG